MSSFKDTRSTERLALVRWAARIGAVTAEAVAERAELTDASARSRLLAAERRGLLARWKPLAGQPALFTVTGAGRRASGTSSLRPARVSASSAQHAIVCAGVAARLERAYPGHLLMGEPELRREETELSGPGFLSAEMAPRGGRGRLHRPDLALCPIGGGALPVAVEVELTVKAPARLAEICRAWARCRRVSGVLYLTPPGVARPLARAIDRAGGADRICVLGLELARAREVACADQPREPSQPARTVGDGGSTI